MCLIDSNRMTTSASNTNCEPSMTQMRQNFPWNGKHIDNVLWYKHLVIRSIKSSEQCCHRLDGCMPSSIPTFHCEWLSKERHKQSSLGKQMGSKIAMFYSHCISRNFNVLVLKSSNICFKFLRAEVLVMWEKILPILKHNLENLKELH